MAIADVGSVGFGLDGLWQLVTGFFADIVARLLAALAGLAHLLVLPLEALWRWVTTTVTDAAGAISADLDGLQWQSVKGFFAGIFVHLSSAVASAAHELVLLLEALWQWLQSAAAAALPVALGAAAVVLLAALVWLCWPALCAVAVAICRALVCVACYLGRGLFVVGTAVAGALSCLVPQCVQFCGVVTMRAPGAAGMLISRAAFEASPVLYFQILRAAGAVVAGAVFCTRGVASVVAAPVAALFGVSSASLWSLRRLFGLCCLVALVSCAIEYARVAGSTSSSSKVARVDVTPHY